MAETEQGPDKQVPQDSSEGANKSPGGSADERADVHMFDRHFWSWMLFFLASYYLASSLIQPQPLEIPYSEFKQAVIEQKIRSISLRADRVTGEYGDSGSEGPVQFITYVPSFGDPGLMTLLETQGVEISTESTDPSTWTTLLLGALPWLLILAFFYYSSRTLQQRLGGMGSAGGGLFGFAKSKARLYENVQGEIDFNDVAGIEHAKDDLREIIRYLKEPQVFRDMGARIPKGVLLMGPPGTGKTLIARATAAEAGVPFFAISGSEFIEMFVGVGASRVRDMFLEARKMAPALVFIDEIDSVGRVRGSGLGGGNDEREQTLNQILAEMDGFSSDEPVVVLAATNRPDVLDPALMRPGRFDRKIVIDLPQKAARRKILDVHVRKMPLDKDVNLDEIAALSIGFSGADLRNLANEAALYAVKSNHKRVSMEDFNIAHDKVRMGAKRADMLNENERHRTAIHESGHAAVAYYLPGTDPLRQVSIIPRGQALGMTEQLPDEDRHNYTESYLKSRMAILLGGRCAESLVFEDVSSGASDDLKNCTQLAKRMVALWGMSERLGPVHYQIGDEHPFLGYELTREKDFSEQTATLIDDEVRRLVAEADQTARSVLTEHRNELEGLARRLLSEETLDNRSIEYMLGTP